MAFERIFGYLWPFLILFGPFVTLSVAIRCYFEVFWDQNQAKIGSCWGDFESFSGRSGSFWSHRRIILASFLASFSGRFWCIFDPFWAVLGFKGEKGHFGGFWVKKKY